MKNSRNPINNEPPSPRIAVQNMQSYSAPLEGRRNLLRLDFNENTLGPSPKVIEVIKKFSSEEIAIYPEYSDLLDLITKTINISRSKSILNTNQIGLFNGVDAAINAIFHSYGDSRDKLLTTIPTFGYYSPCAAMRGMEVMAIPYKTGSFEFPFNLISNYLKEHTPKLLIICNPNNPTGTMLDPSKIIELAKISPKTLVIIDEVYEAFLGQSVIPIINFNDTKNIIILRSLSKTAGLAGLRIGFAIGNSQVIDHIKSVTGPYDINSFAVAAAYASLSDASHTKRYVEEVIKAREWIKNKLIYHDIRYHIDAGNYFLIWPKKETKLVENLLKKSGILVRNMSGKYLIDKSLRVSIGTLEQMKFFWEVFEKIETKNQSKT